MPPAFHNVHSYRLHMMNNRAMGFTFGGGRLNRSRA